MKNKIVYVLLILALILVVIGVDLFIPRKQESSKLDYSNDEKLIHTYSIIENEEKFEIIRYHISPLEVKMIYERSDDGLYSNYAIYTYKTKAAAIFNYLQMDLNEYSTKKLKGNSFYVYRKGASTLEGVQTLINTVKTHKETILIDPIY